MTELDDCDEPIGEDAEPQLKYCKLEADASVILSRDAATCFAASDKVHALGCTSGSVHVLDFEGHQVQVLKDHAAAVTGVAFDSSLEYLASCAADNSIVLRNIYRLDDRPWRTQLASATSPACIAVNPWVRERQTREVAVGTHSGHVALVARGWLGNREHLLASGEGPVHSVVWLGSCIVWATDVGVHAFVHDASAHRHGVHLPRPPSAGTGDCSIKVVGKDVLLIAWPHAVQVVKLVTSPMQLPDVGGRGLTAAPGPGLALQLVASFLTVFRVHGVAPFGPDLAVLADSAAARPSSHAENPPVPAPPPPLLPAATSPGAVDSAADSSRTPQSGSREPTSYDRTYDDADGSELPSGRPPALSPSDTLERRCEAPPERQATANPAMEGDSKYEPTAASDAVPSRPNEGDQHECLASRRLLLVEDPAADHSAVDAPPAIEPGPQGADSAADAADPGSCARDSHAPALACATTAGGAATGDAAGASSRPASLEEATAQPSTAWPDVSPDAGASDRSAQAAEPPPMASPETRPNGSRTGDRDDGQRDPSLSSAAAGLPAAGADVQHVPQSPRKARAQLKVMTFQGAELCSDAIQVEQGFPGDTRLLRLVSWYPERYSTAAAAPRLTSPAAPAAASSLRDKWWQDEDEPLYYVVTPRGITLGKPCDADDQASWLLRRGKFAAAVDVVRAASYVRPETRKECVSSYISHLIQRGKYEAAAAAAAELLGDDSEAWERVVFEFGQRRQLPTLAPHVPTRAPLLGGTAYLMVLASFISRGGDHAALLALLQRWPPAIIKADELGQRASQLLATLPEAAQPPLLRVLAYLYRLQSRHEQALNILIHLDDPSVFAYVRQFHLFPGLPRYAPLLMNIDERQAIALLVEHRESMAVRDVCRGLQGLVAAAERSSRAPEALVWRRRLHLYLHALFLRDRAATQDFHDLQVPLYAEFQPDFLLTFLHASKSYQLEAAMLVCQRGALVREQVYVLGRMGRLEDALRLIVSQLHDVPQAIGFVNSQGDDALWDKLIQLTIVDADLTGALLDRIGGYVDPLRLVRAIPNQLKIPELNARLQRIINDFHTSTQLSEGCNAIIIADCMSLMNTLMRIRQRPLDAVYLFVDSHHAGRWELLTVCRGARASCPPPDIPRDAASFNPPQHTLGLPLQAQLIIRLADAAGRRSEGNGRTVGRGDVNTRGQHAILAVVERLNAGHWPAVLDVTSINNSMRLWSGRDISVLSSP